MAQFYFALTGPSETSFEAGHKREDASWISAVIEHREGGPARLAIAIRNEHVGLLAPGREQWCWLAWDSGSETYPLFRGRMVAVPDDMQAEAITVIFVARPADYTAQKAALAETLKVAPYDPVFIRPEDRNDPDIVLEHLAKLYHHDRVTHEVTVSDIANGEAGTLDLGAIAYDSLHIQPSGAPLPFVIVTLDVSWQQQAEGTIDLSPAILAAFQDADSGDGHTAWSLTGHGLISRWFEADRNIGSGWSVASASVVRGDGIFAEPEEADVVLATQEPATFPISKVVPLLAVRYDAARSYSERLTLAITADVQAVETDFGDEPPEAIRAGGPVDEPLDEEGGEPAIGDLRRRQYFVTDRGRRSIEYGIALGRARMVKAARAVEVSATCQWRPELLGISCRHNATIADPRIPGGTATGKVIGYVLACEGGRQTIGVTIGCMVGKGNEVTAVAGDPLYVEDGVLEDGIQARSNAVIVPESGDIGYSGDYAQTGPADDGIDFFRFGADAAVQEIAIGGALPEQRAVVGDSWETLSAALQALNQVHTTVCVSLTPLRAGPFEQAYDLGALDLMIAKTIDLEAA